MLHRCEHCGVIKTTFRRYTKQLRHFHESAANFHVTCNISGCKDTFKVVRCFVRHVSRKHQDVSTECSLASSTVEIGCNFVSFVIARIQLHAATYVLPEFPQTVRSTLAQKNRQLLLPGTANRAHVTEALAEDLILRKIWLVSFKLSTV